MPPRFALEVKRARFGARRAAASAPCPVRGGGASIREIGALTRLSDRLDSLLRDASCVRSQGEYDRLADEAHAIADGLHTIFRGEGTPRNAPRWQRGGKAAW
jgi:hypothetical protein